MFTVNHQASLISPVKIKTFSELGFTARKHEQLSTRSGLWLAHQINALRDVLWQIGKGWNAYEF